MQWAPKRRESYYLMSERVYNDRVLMKMRADAGDSPLNFDFANTDGDTDNLHEFQQFINKTSSDIKDLRFDSNYKDYTYYFDKEQKKSSEEKSARAEGENENEERELHEVLGSKSQRKLALDDHVTESNTDRIDSKSSEWSQQTEKRNEVGGLDPCDVKLSFGEFRFSILNLVLQTKFILFCNMYKFLKAGETIFLGNMYEEFQGPLNRKLNFEMQLNKIEM